MLINLFNKQKKIALFNLLVYILTIEQTRANNSAHDSLLEKYICMERTLRLENVPVESSFSKDRPIVTIWVHGTKGTARMLPFKMVQLFFDCFTGLNHYTAFAPEYHHRKIAELLYATDSEQFPLEHFYIFGWVGTLSFQDREQASYNLHCQITQLIQKYTTQYGCTPYVRIITHSHGGNVVLNLARWPNTYVVDELILLACPVQVATAQLAQAPLFKMIFHLFSKADIFQIIDMQGLYKNPDKAPLFSQRKFLSSANMIQIALKKGHRPLAHVEFLLNYFLRLLPTVLAKARTLHQDVEQADIIHTINIKKFHNSQHPFTQSI